MITLIITKLSYMQKALFKKRHKESQMFTQSDNFYTHISKF